MREIHLPGALSNSYCVQILPVPSAKETSRFNQCFLTTFYRLEAIASAAGGTNDGNPNLVQDKITYLSVGLPKMVTFFDLLKEVQKGLALLPRHLVDIGTSGTYATLICSSFHPSVMHTGKIKGAKAVFERN